MIFRTLTLCLAFGLGAAPILRCAEPAGLHPLREGTELFVDNVKIAAQSGVRLHLHAAEKLAAPVIVGDRAWEGDRVYIYGTTLRDPDTGLFRMWYGSSAGGVLYATSLDGIAWTKPPLDVFPYHGQPTNLVWRNSAGPAVLYDVLEPDPLKRYKALIALSRVQRKEGGFRGLYSADGIHWHEYPQYPVLPFGTEMGNLIRDPATHKYIAYIRPYWVSLHPKRVEEKRLGAVTTSDDFLHWTPLRVELTPDALDDRWVTNPDQRTEFYAMNGFPYGQSYLGVVPRFMIQRLIPKPGKEQSSVDGPLEGQLIVSRNGLDWHRLPDRTPVIPSGTTFDRSIMNIATAPLVVRDQIYFYYTGINTTHGGPLPPKKIAVCLARWRLDGFASLDAGPSGGTIETTILTGPGALEVNAEAAGGEVRVAVLDASARPLPGYAAEDCVPLQGDGVHQRVRWAGHAQPPSAAGYRLRFVLRNASLYSYTICR